MKTPHSRTRFAFVCSAAAIFAFSHSPPVWGQDDAVRAVPPSREEGAKLPEAQRQSRGSPQQRREGQQKDASDGRTAMETIIPEINVPAGQHLKGFVDFLSDKTGANFVLEESLKELKLPALKLRNVTILSVLDAVRMISKEGIAISYSEDRGPGALVVTVTPSRRNETAKPKKICRVFRLVLSGPPWMAPIDDETTRKALDERVRHISNAARTASYALAAANGRTKAEADYPQIEVHAPTHLLMVIGQEADVDLVGQIISGIGGVPMQGAKPELPKPQ